jgi:hypothetical protein
MSVYGACQQEEEEEGCQALLLHHILKNSGETKGQEKGLSPEIILKVGGQFIGLQDDLKNIINKQIQGFSCICPAF